MACKSKGPFDPNKSPGGDNRGANSISIAAFISPGQFVTKQPRLARVNAEATLPALTRFEIGKFPIGTYGLISVVFPDGTLSASQVARIINEHPDNKHLRASVVSGTKVKIQAKEDGVKFFIQFGTAIDSLGFDETSDSITSVTTKQTAPFYLKDKVLNLLVDTASPFGDEIVTEAPEIPANTAVEYLILANEEGELVATNRESFFLEYEAGTLQAAELAECLNELTNLIHATVENGRVVITPTDPLSKIQILGVPAAETQNDPNKDMLSIINAAFIEPWEAQEELVNPFSPTFDPALALSNGVELSIGNVVDILSSTPPGPPLANAATVLGFQKNQTTVGLGESLRTKTGPFVFTKTSGLYFGVNFFNSGKLISNTVKVQYARNSARQTRFNFNSQLQRWSLIDASLGNISNGNPETDIPRLKLPVAKNDFIGDEEFPARPVDFKILVAGQEFTVLPVDNETDFGSSNSGNGPNSLEVEFARLEQTFNFSSDDLSLFEDSEVVHQEVVDGERPLNSELTVTLTGNNVTAKELADQINAVSPLFRAKVKIHTSNSLKDLFKDRSGGTPLPGIFENFNVDEQFVEVSSALGSEITVELVGGSSGVPAILTAGKPGPYVVSSKGLKIQVDDGIPQSFVFPSAPDDLLSTEEIAAFINQTAKGFVAEEEPSEISISQYGKADPTKAKISEAPNVYDFGGTKNFRVTLGDELQEIPLTDKMSLDDIVDTLNIKGRYFTASKFAGNYLQIARNPLSKDPASVIAFYNGPFLSLQGVTLKVRTDKGTEEMTFGDVSSLSDIVDDINKKLDNVVADQITGPKLRLSSTTTGIAGLLEVQDCTAVLTFGFVPFVTVRGVDRNSQVMRIHNTDANEILGFTEEMSLLSPTPRLVLRRLKNGAAHKLTVRSTDFITPVQDTDGNVFTPALAVSANSNFGFVSGQNVKGADKLFGTDKEAQDLVSVPKIVSGSKTGPFKFDRADFNFILNGIERSVSIDGDPAEAIFPRVSPAFSYPMTGLSLQVNGGSVQNFNLSGDGSIAALVTHLNASGVGFTASAAGTKLKLETEPSGTPTPSIRILSADTAFYDIVTTTAKEFGPIAAATFPKPGVYADLDGKTLEFQINNDPQVTLTFGGNPTDAQDVVDKLLAFLATIPHMTATLSGTATTGQPILMSFGAGLDPKITILPSGTSNSTFGFSTSQATIVDTSNTGIQAEEIAAAINTEIGALSGMCGREPPAVTSIVNGNAIAFASNGEAGLEFQIKTGSGNEIFGFPPGARLSEPNKIKETDQAEEPESDPVVTSAVPNIPPRKTKAIRTLKPGPYSYIDGQQTTFRFSAGQAEIERGVDIYFKPALDNKDKDISASQNVRDELLVKGLRGVSEIPLSTLPDETKEISLRYDPVPLGANDPLLLGEDFVVNKARRSIQFTRRVVNESVHEAPDTFIRRTPAVTLDHVDLAPNTLTIRGRFNSSEGFVEKVRDLDYAVDESAGLIHVLKGSTPSDPNGSSVIIEEPVVDNVFLPDLSFLMSNFSLKKGTTFPLTDADRLDLSEFSLTGNGGWVQLDKPLAPGEHLEVDYISESLATEIVGEVMRKAEFNSSATPIQLAPIAGDVTKTSHIPYTVIEQSGEFYRVESSVFDPVADETNVILRQVSAPLMSAEGNEEAFETRFPPVQVSNFVAIPGELSIKLSGNQTGTYPSGGSYIFGGKTFTIAASEFDSSTNYTSIYLSADGFELPGRFVAGSTTETIASRFEAGKIIRFNGNRYFFITTSAYNQDSDSTIVVLGGKLPATFRNPATFFTKVVSTLVFSTIEIQFAPVPGNYNQINIGPSVIPFKQGQFIFMALKSDLQQGDIYKLQGTQIDETGNTILVLETDTVSPYTVFTHTLAYNSTVIPDDGTTEIRLNFPPLLAVPSRVDANGRGVPIKDRFPGLESSIEVKANGVTLQRNVQYTIDDSGLIVLTNVGDVEGISEEDALRLNQAVTENNFNITANYIARRETILGEELQADYTYVAKSARGVDLYGTFTLPSPDVFYVQVQSESALAQRVLNNFRKKIESANGQTSQGAKPTLPAQRENFEEGMLSNIGSVSDVYDLDHITAKMTTYFHDRINLLEDEWEELRGHVIGGYNGRVTVNDIEKAALGLPIPTRLFPFGEVIEKATEEELAKKVDAFSQSEESRAKELADFTGLEVDPAAPLRIPALFGLALGDNAKVTIPDNAYVLKDQANFFDNANAFASGFTGRPVPDQPFGYLADMSHIDKIRKIFQEVTDNPADSTAALEAGLLLAGAIATFPVGSWAFGQAFLAVTLKNVAEGPVVYHPFLDRKLVPEELFRLKKPLFRPGSKLYDRVFLPQGLEGEIGSLFPPSDNGGYEGDGTENTSGGGLFKEEQSLIREFGALQSLLDPGFDFFDLFENPVSKFGRELRVQQGALKEQINSLARQKEALEDLISQIFPAPEDVSTPQGYTVSQARTMLGFVDLAITNAKTALRNIRTFLNLLLSTNFAKPSESILENRLFFIAGGIGTGSLRRGRLGQVQLRKAVIRERVRQLRDALGYTGDVSPYASPPNPPEKKPNQTENLYNLRFLFLEERLNTQNGSRAAYRQALKKYEDDLKEARRKNSLLEIL